LRTSTFASSPLTTCAAINAIFEDACPAFPNGVENSPDKAVIDAPFRGIFAAVHRKSTLRGNNGKSNDEN
jgi:hypothetical protein